MHRLQSFGLVLSLAAGACADSGDDSQENSDQTPIACDADCDTAFVDRGAHAAGFSVHDVDGLTLKVWYPTAEPPSAIDYTIDIKFEGWPDEPGTIHGEAVHDAPIADDGPYPLVVLSHGFSGHPEWYRTIAEHLASHGFVVVGPEHAESDWFTDVVAASLTRPREVSAAIDFALEGPFSAAVDGDHVAVLGHSYGGYTALAVAGARYDLDDLAERCADVEDEFTAAYFCSTFLDQRDTLSDPPVLADDRVDAVVALAGDAYLFGSKGLANITVPVLSVGGTADSGTPWDWGSNLSHQHVSGQRFLVGFEGGEHFLPMASCADMPWTALLPEFEQGYICNDPAWDKQAALDHVHQFTTAFLQATLRQDPVAIEALAPEHYDDTGGLLYQAN